MYHSCDSLVSPSHTYNDNEYIGFHIPTQALEALRPSGGTRLELQDLQEGVPMGTLWKARLKQVWLIADLLYLAILFF